MSDFLVRPAEPDDLRFVCASWFESFWKGAMQHTGMQYADYKRGQDALIRCLLERSRVSILGHVITPGEIVGYAVIEPTPGAHERADQTVHYCYVKSSFRRFGAAKGLLRGKCTRYSHMTKAGNRVARSLGLVYDPYTLSTEGAP